MKIGLVCPYNIARGGGVQEHVFAVQAELRSRGHEVYIITPQPKDYEPGNEKGVIFIGSATDFNSPLHTTVQVSAGVNETIDNMLAKHKFDILHFHEPWVPMLSAQILSRSNAVNIATFHARLPETLMSRAVVKAVRPYTKSVLKYIDAYTAVSEAAAEYVSKLTSEQIALVPNGVNLEVYKNVKRRSDRKKHKTIFYLGRLEQRKGVKHLLHAFQHLLRIDSDVSLIIAGDGPEREKLESLAAELDLDGHVTFAGYIAEKEKVRYLQTADLYCSPALYGESFGVVLLEAMATGLVTVAGDNPGYAGVMEGIGKLSLIHPQHHDEFARRLELLLRENDLRKLWREWAEKQIKQYAFPVIVKQYEDVYKKALREHKPREGKITER